MSITISLRQLEYLSALAKALNFREAAEDCYVTQPALSAQIQQLEGQLGVKLFERDRRTVSLTHAGTRILERARRVLEEVEAIEDEARALQQPLCGALRLGVIPTVAPYVLPQALPALKREYPELRLLIHEDQTDRLFELLRASDLDLLLLALEVDVGDAVTMPLYRDPFLLAVPEGHELATRAQVRLSDLADLELLLLTDGHCLRDHALEVCELSGARETDDFRASSLNTLVRMVAVGTGVTLLPAMSIEAEVHASDALATRALADSAPARSIGLAWRKPSARQEEFRMVGKLFAEHPPAGVVPLG